MNDATSGNPHDLLICNSCGIETQRDEIERQREDGTTPACDSPLGRLGYPHDFRRELYVGRSDA